MHPHNSVELLKDSESRFAFWRTRPLDVPRILVCWAVFGDVDGAKTQDDPWNCVATVAISRSVCSLSCNRDVCVGVSTPSTSTPTEIHKKSLTSIPWSILSRAVPRWYTTKYSGYDRERPKTRRSTGEGKRKEVSARDMSQQVSESKLRKLTRNIRKQDHDSCFSWEPK